MWVTTDQLGTIGLCVKLQEGRSEQAAPPCRSRGAQFRAMSGLRSPCRPPIIVLVGMLGELRNSVSKDLGLTTHPAADNGDASARLPWESAAGEPSGDGICLSGGGLRAAAFSLGAIQALQQHAGLLYGRKAVDNLAVVSGGSYVGGAFMLTAASPVGVPSPFPLSDGAPETNHVLSNGRYLIEDGVPRSLALFGSRLLANAVAGAVLLCWTAVMMADLAVIIGRIPVLPVWPTPWRSVGPGVLFIAIGLLASSTLTDRGFKRYVSAGGGLIGLVVSAPSSAATVLGNPALSSPGWWWDHWFISLTILGLFVLATTVSGLASLGRRIPAVMRAGSDSVARNAPRVVSFLLMCFVLAAVEPWIVAVFEDQLTDTEILWVAIFFFGILLAGLLASYIPDVASLHRPYRDRLARCFGVRRVGGATVELLRPSTIARVSSLVPPAKGSTTCFPRLLICATANVRNRSLPDKRRRNVCSFVFSHDRSGVPGVGDASFATEKLELGRARTGVMRGWEPEFSLMGGLGVTGAALAPSMGSMTIVGLRPILALLNARLGVWLPNPLSPTRRDVVAARPQRPPWWSDRRKEYGKLGPGFDALVGEFFGLHGEDARRIFVTDGGHYDNLGLLALLRARSRTIWCVDAYSGRKNLGRQLERVVELAATELSVTIDVDTSRFNLLSGSDSMAANAVAIGTIEYPATNERGTLIVLKLAFTPTTPRDLVEYRQQDRLFPYHPTWVQWFGKARFDNYRRLGHHVAMEALASAQ